MVDDDLRGGRAGRSTASGTRRSRDSRSDGTRGRGGRTSQAAVAAGLDSEARRVIDGAGSVSDTDVDGGALRQVDGPGVRVASHVVGNGGQSGSRSLALGDGSPVCQLGPRSRIGVVSTGIRVAIAVTLQKRKWQRKEVRRDHCGPSNGNRHRISRSDPPMI